MKTAIITSLTAREILDSRGNPTIEVVCVLRGGAEGTASVPSGASTGIHEAHELRDHDLKRYNGKGVLNAVAHVNNEIAACVNGKEFDQATLDATLCALDGTKDKSQLGANAILGVSLAFARAKANDEHIELYEYLGRLSSNEKFILPQPAFNIINGGKHADSDLDIQEFMLVPIGFTTIHQKIQVAAEVIVALRTILKNKGLIISVGDEGGFAPKLSSNEEALDLIQEAIAKVGYTFDQVKIAIDVAASSFYHDGIYTLRVQGEEKNITSEEIVAWYVDLVSKYPIISIEDGLAEDDWHGFTALNAKLGGKMLVVGDDLTVTNSARIQEAIDAQAINAVLIKPNQIGTLSETIQAIKLTQAQGWKAFISHRSGETIDTFIADLAVGLACPYIKAGSLARGERICKYNRLMEIEDILKSRV
jgi:enolase